MLVPAVEKWEPCSCSLLQKSRAAQVAPGLLVLKADTFPSCSVLCSCALYIFCENDWFDGKCFKYYVFRVTWSKRYYVVHQRQGLFPYSDDFLTLIVLIGRHWINWLTCPCPSTWAGPETTWGSACLFPLTEKKGWGDRDNILAELHSLWLSEVTMTSHCSGCGTPWGWVS